MSKTAETFAMLYSLVPRMADCKGLCHDTCDINPAREASAFEHSRLRRAGVPDLPADTPANAKTPCPALTAKNRCGQYAIRPMICRLWGTAPSMACEHSCTPVEWLSDAQAVELMLTSFQAGFHPDMPDAEVLQVLRDGLYDPELRPLVIAVFQARRDPAQRARASDELAAAWRRKGQPAA